METTETAGPDKSVGPAALVVRRDEWVSLSEAAKLLGCSERNIQRRAALGEIERRTLPKRQGERAAPVVYSRAGVLTLKSGKNLPAGENRAKLVARHSQTIVNGAAASGFGFPNAAALLPLFSPPAKPWLSIAEIAKYSGLPAPWWRQRAPELARAGAAVNVGRGERPRWRVLFAAAFVAGGVQSLSHS